MSWRWRTRSCSRLGWRRARRVRRRRRRGGRNSSLRRSVRRRRLMRRSRGCAARLRAARARSRPRGASARSRLPWRRRRRRRRRSRGGSRRRRWRLGGRGKLLLQRNAPQRANRSRSRSRRTRVPRRSRGARTRSRSWGASRCRSGQSAPSSAGRRAWRPRSACSRTGACPGRRGGVSRRGATLCTTGLGSSSGIRGRIRTWTRCSATRCKPRKRRCKPGRISWCSRGGTFRRMGMTSGRCSRLRGWTRRVRFSTGSRLWRSGFRMRWRRRRLRT
mmetsp:Transcript_49685/g.113162  ORF Transcript_49685/g.113162 Transcript_49685/m.113162 type:complete len:275 (-) Transcript_49685:306-1130(-)